MPDFPLCKCALHTLNRHVKKNNKAVFSITHVSCIQIQPANSIRVRCYFIHSLHRSHFSFPLLRYSIESKTRSFQFQWRSVGAFFLPFNRAYTSKKRTETIIILVHSILHMFELQTNCRCAKQFVREMGEKRWEEIENFRSNKWPKHQRRDMQRCVANAFGQCEHRA